MPNLTLKPHEEMCVVIMAVSYSDYVSQLRNMLGLGYEQASEMYRKNDVYLTVSPLYLYLIDNDLSIGEVLRSYEFLRVRHTIRDNAGEGQAAELDKFLRATRGDLFIHSDYILGNPNLSFDLCSHLFVKPESLNLLATETAAEMIAKRYKAPDTPSSDGSITTRNKLLGNFTVSVREMMLRVYMELNHSRGVSKYKDVPAYLRSSGGMACRYT